MRLVFGSYNAHKLAEVRAMLPPRVIVWGLASLDNIEEVPETGNTLVENALLKARGYAQRTGQACFADDTGLEIAALQGKPGVYSARYAAQATAEANIQKVLSEMAEITERNAQFRTVIAFCHPKDTREFWVSGALTGTITSEPRGHFGFGYDPIFQPTNLSQTLAELTPEQKNTLSHRKKAIRSFIKQLSKYYVL